MDLKRRRVEIKSQRRGQRDEKEGTKTYTVENSRENF